MKMRWIAAAALALLLLTGLSAAGESLRFGVVSGSASVNLRQGTGQNTARLGSYSRGTWLRILGSSGSWYKVSGPDGKTGYVSRSRVTEPSLRYSDVAYVRNPRSSSFLNLRQQPSYNARVLGIYYNGVPAMLLSTSGGWSHVMVNGVDGYFRQEYLRITGHIPCAGAVATIVTPSNSALNLRQGPGYGYPAVTQLYGGNYVMVLQKGTDWYLVSAEGVVGYMSAAYLRDGILSPSEALAAGNAISGRTVGASAQVNAQPYALVSNPKPTQVLNLRDAPSTGGKVLGRFVSGTRLKVLSQGIEWCRVQVVKTGASGYMMTDYLKLVNLPDTPTKTVSHPGGSYVNLRSDSSMKAEVISRVADGTQAVVLIPGETWSKVRCGGVTGWMMSAFLK